MWDWDRKISVGCDLGCTSEIEIGCEWMSLAVVYWWSQTNSNEIPYEVNSGYTFGCDANLWWSPCRLVSIMCCDPHFLILYHVMFWYYDLVVLWSRTAVWIFMRKYECSYRQSFRPSPNVLTCAGYSICGMPISYFHRLIFLQVPLQPNCRQEVGEHIVLTYVIYILRSYVIYVLRSYVIFVLRSYVIYVLRSYVIYVLRSPCLRPPRTIVPCIWL